MSDVRECPSCGLINPPTAVYCDCGWNFLAVPKPAGVADIRSIARGQRLMLTCFLMRFALVLGAVPALMMAPDIFVPVVVIAELGFGVALLVFVVKLAVRVYPGGSGVALGLLAAVPYVGFVALLVVNAAATKRLRRQGVRVGLLGARTADIETPRAGRYPAAEFDEP